LSHQLHAAVFEPHIRQDDLTWHPVEEMLTMIDSQLSFWKDTAHLGMLDQRQPVSMNLLDVALSYCNKLPFEKRLVQYFQHSLWHELLLRYLRHDTVEQTVMQALQPQLARQPVIA
jgi:hypothetical protein